MQDDNRENRDSQQDNRGAAILRWLFSMPPVARPLIAAIAVGWWLCLVGGAWVENYQMPLQPLWLSVWKGSLGGNGFSAFGALVLTFLLTSEVTIMIFTLAGNRRRIADAAAKAREEERQRIRQQTADWYQSAKEDVAAGRDLSPPPILGDNGNKPS